MIVIRDIGISCHRALWPTRETEKGFDSITGLKQELNLTRSRVMDPTSVRMNRKRVLKSTR